MQKITVLIALLALAGCQSQESSFQAKHKTIMSDATQTQQKSQAGFSGLTFLI
jgi:hypothetical protein